MSAELLGAITDKVCVAVAVLDPRDDGGKALQLKFAL